MSNGLVTLFVIAPIPHVTEIFEARQMMRSDTSRDLTA